MTAIAATQPELAQNRNPTEGAAALAPDLFTLILDEARPAAAAGRVNRIGRQGAAAAPGKSKLQDPASIVNPTDAAVAQLSTRSAPKATVRAAEGELTAPRSSPSPPGPRGRIAPKSASAEGPAHADSGGPREASSNRLPSATGPMPVATMPAQGQTVKANNSAPPVVGAAKAGRIETAAHASSTRPANHALPARVDRVSGPAPRALVRPNLAPAAQTQAMARASTPRGPAAKPEDPEAAFAAQLGRGCAAMLRQNGGSLTLHLQPQALGEMTIRMELKPGKVAASFEVQNDQAQQLLTAHLTTLRSALEARGLNVDSLAVHVSERAAQDAHHSAGPGTAFGGADQPGGGAAGSGNGGTGTDRPDAGAVVQPARIADEPEWSPEAGVAPGVDKGGAHVIRPVLDAVG